MPYAGAKIGPAFSDDFYHKIYILPRTIELGNFTDTSKDFIVWNAYFNDRDFSVINTTAVAADDLTLTGNASGAMPGLSVYDYALDAGAAGSPALDVTYTWDFSGAVVDPVLVVLGQRVILLPWVARDKATKRLSWKTGVVKAYGQEQRRGLRRAPLQEISYRIHVPDQDRIDLESRLTDLTSLYAVPLWWLRQDVGVLTAGVTTIVMDTDYRFLQPGGLLYLYESTGLHEAKTIDTVLAGSVTLTSALTNNYTNAQAVATLACYAKNIGMTRRGEKINFASFDFTSTDFYELPADTYTQYKGLDVLLDPTVTVAAVPMQVVQSRVWRDNGIGPLGVGNKENRVRVQDTQRWIKADLEGRYKLEQWFNSRYGQRVPFYQPTWQKDFVVTADIGNTAAFFDVESTHKLAPFEIMLELNDGTQFFREVITKAVQGSGHRLNIDSAFGQAITAASIKRVCVLRLTRHAADSVTLNYQSPNITRAEIPTTTH
ncbi:MAG: hypothetical protein AB9Q22_10250 [Candidatus Reddybacter sp.]